MGGFIGALLFVAAILSAPWLLGMTFGQRCASSFDRNTAAHEACVERLEQGGGIHHEKIVTYRPI